MKIKRHHFYTTLIALALMLSAVTLLFINDWLSKRILPQVNVRKIQVASLPPPPPPPAPQQVQQTQQTLTLSIEGEGPAMDVSLIKVEQPKILLTPPKMAMPMQVEVSNDLQIDWQAFGLDQLDSIPTLLTKVTTIYPRALVKRGIKKVVLRLDVFIDEHGKPRLITIEGLAYQELTSAVNKLIKRSRFTPPTKDGQSVAARFIWPVEFKKS